VVTFVTNFKTRNNETLSPWFREALLDCNIEKVVNMRDKNKDTVNSNLVQYLLQTNIQKRTKKIQWQIQTLHRDFSLGNPNRENQHILYSYIVLHCLQYNIHIGASGIQNPNPMTWISPKP
jgi:hypothetical protein